MARLTPPLNPDLPMVDPDTGKPTPFFMRWWQDQVDSNKLIADLSTPAAVSAVLDVLGGASHGSVLYRGTSLWALLAPGTANQFLRTNAVGNNPSWAAPTFLQLGDSPASYSGQAGQAVIVNPGETGLTFGSGGGGGGGGSNFYDLQTGFESTPTSSQVLDTVVIVREVTYPANFSGSAGSIDTNPTASFAIDVRDDGVSIGTITIDTSGNFTFATTSGTAKTVAAGSVLTFVAPGTADATAANARWTLLGTVPGNDFYDIQSGFTSTPTASQVLDTQVIGREVTLPANLSGSGGTIATNPTASFAVDVRDDGVSIGTITIDTAGNFTFTTVSGTAKTVAAGSVVTFIGPSPADASAANAVWTLLGTA